MVSKGRVGLVFARLLVEIERSHDQQVQTGSLRVRFVHALAMLMRAKESAARAVASESGENGQTSLPDRLEVEHSMETQRDLLADITPTSGPTRAILDPATGEAIGKAPEHGVDGLEQAIAVAVAAQPAWAALGHEAHSATLLKTSDAVDVGAEELAGCSPGNKASPSTVRTHDSRSVLAQRGCAPRHALSSPRKPSSMTAPLMPRSTTGPSASSTPITPCTR
jgi:hypothetical protein